MRQALVTGLLFLLFTGCATAGASFYTAEYEASLSEVRRPADAERRYGAKEVTETDSSYTFEDEFVKSTWVPANGVFYVDIKNKTENSIQIDWNQGAYVGPDGNSQRLMHGEVRRYQANQSLPPTVIPAGGSASKTIGSMEAFEGELFPVSYVGADSSGVASFRKRVDAFEETEVQVLLPLKIEEEVNEYTFTFDVTDARVDKE